MLVLMPNQHATKTWEAEHPNLLEKSRGVETAWGERWDDENGTSMLRFFRHCQFACQRIFSGLKTRRAANGAGFTQVLGCGEDGDPLATGSSFGPLGKFA
jgi:hypothetical protein